MSNYVKWHCHSVALAKDGVAFRGIWQTIYK